MSEKPLILLPWPNSGGELLSINVGMETGTKEVSKAALSDSQLQIQMYYTPTAVDLPL